MSNEKHYPTHPGAEHPPIMTCEIPLEEYESLNIRDHFKGNEKEAKDEAVKTASTADSADPTDAADGADSTEGTE